MTHPDAIVPAPLAFNDQGVPLSSAYDDVYHSTDGGLEQARHVFLGGNGLPERWQDRDRFTVLETGFGLGLNFLATWDAWRRDPARSGRLHFVSVELHPFRRDDLAQLHQRWPELAALSAELLAAWPPLTPGVHRLLLDAGRVTLTLFLGDALKLLPKMVARADALYLDGFAPAKNPALWSPGLIRTVSRLCVPGASLATWSVASEVRQSLGHQGWQLDKSAGFGRKREMLVGRFAPVRSKGTGAPRPAAADPSGVADKRALVIGAGVAGCATAERLAARGWQVRLLERRDGPAQEASGNLVGLMHPVLSRDDNFMARITRACALYGARLFATLAAENPGLRWGASGVLQLARDGEQEKQQRQTIEALGFPADYARYVDATEASALAGAPVAAGAWYYPGSGWLSPPTLCRALLARWPVTATFNAKVAHLSYRDGEWRALAANGQVLASAPQVILASAHETLSLVPELPLSKVRGQVSIASTAAQGGAIPALKAALCGNGYLTPALDGRHCFGATFDFNDDDPHPRAEGHVTNLDHLRALLPGIDLSAFDPQDMEGRVGFRTATPDRLPLVGPLPDTAAFLADPLRREAQLAEVPRQPGLHCLVGLGSRGMVWAPLAAELLASRLDGDPLPLERELADALDPSRFLLRSQRKNSGS
ncbi:bifunctional tRNA (5-methylaminomethyl-2-thiouridine)(34)-methyltransferase MnmD/FAD-dependent 5-carboxymethylaminomethyl-2-thiouridine(34) oxidoreductase MnmC [Denitratisoma sp. agr-D3]